uniref:Uncharacterized protein n=1 Tax=Anguilla anguilla TaxID=7936 RepID=A0A0E9X1L2_ANGAN
MLFIISLNLEDVNGLSDLESIHLINQLSLYLLSFTDIQIVLVHSTVLTMMPEAHKIAFSN